MWLAGFGRAEPRNDETPPPECLAKGRVPGTRLPSTLVTEATAPHRHGRWTHSHPHRGPHRHLVRGRRTSEPLEPLSPQAERHGDEPHTHGHGHSHGLVDRSIVRSREGVKAVALSLAILGLTAAAQLAIFLVSSSVALLADLIHNFGDALTAVPLGIAFFLRSSAQRSSRGSRSCSRFRLRLRRPLRDDPTLHQPQDLTHLWVLAAAGLIGFGGNELAAQVRLRAGRRLSSPALVADGNHARTDGFVSLGVVASAIIVALGDRR